MYVHSVHNTQCSLVGRFQHEPDKFTCPNLPTLNPAIHACQLVQMQPHLNPISHPCPHDPPAAAAASAAASAAVFAAAAAAVAAWSRGEGRSCSCDGERETQLQSAAGVVRCAEIGAKTVGA